MSEVMLQWLATPQGTVYSECKAHAESVHDRWIPDAAIHTWWLWTLQLIRHVSRERCSRARQQDVHNQGAGTQQGQTSGHFKVASGVGDSREYLVTITTRVFVPSPAKSVGTLRSKSCLFGQPASGRCSSKLACSSASIQVLPEARSAIRQYLPCSNPDSHPLIEVRTVLFGTASVRVLQPKIGVQQRIHPGAARGAFCH